MKTSKYFIIAMTFLALVGCKNEKADERADVVEEETMEVAPNESDIKFAAALEYLKNEEGPQAAKSIKEGLAEVSREAKNTFDRGSESFEALTTKLSELATTLENGGDVQIDKVRKLMAEIEINVHHSYLGTDDIYFPSDESSSDNAEASHKKLSAIISNLRDEEGKVKGDTKTEYDALMAEGKKLENDFQGWDKRTVEYDKRVIEHKQKQIPE